MIYYLLYDINPISAKDLLQQTFLDWDDRSVKHG